MALMSKAPDRALIGGEWVEGSAGTFEVRSPHSREVVNTVSRCDSADVDRAVAAARRAQPDWAATPLIERAKILRRITDVLPRARRVDRPDGVRGDRQDDHRRREEVYEYAAPCWRRPPSEVLRHRGLSLPSTQEQTNNKRLVLGHRPLGVVGVDHAVQLPDRYRVDRAGAHHRCRQRRGLEAVRVRGRRCCHDGRRRRRGGRVCRRECSTSIHGFGDVGAAIVEHDDVDGIFFTGSTATGEQIARQRAAQASAARTRRRRPIHHPRRR